MAGTFPVQQSGGAITISSTALGFTQNSANQYYLNSGGVNTNPTTQKFTFTFADGASFYITDLNNGATASSTFQNVVGIPSTADAGYGSTININGGSTAPNNNNTSTYDIYGTVNNVDILLIDNFRPQGSGNTYYQDPIANFEYTSGTLTVRTPTRSGGQGYADIYPFNGVVPAGAVTYNPTPNGYRGGAAGTLGPNAQSQYISGGINTPWVFSLKAPATTNVLCFYQGTQITQANGQNISVEDLNIGDLIHTHKGILPLKWLGRRKVTKSVRQQYPHQLPVVIEGGALGFNMPSTDLMVSQGHTILVEGHLICACLLENDINCYRANCDDLPDDFEYFHLEFAEEEVLLLSNGTPTASYVNTQSRMMFDNYQEYIDLYGDLNAEIKPLEYKHRRTACFLDPYKAVVRRSFQEPTAGIGVSKLVPGL